MTVVRAANTNDPSSLTDEQLLREHSRWDLAVRQISQWGPAMERAERERERFAAEIKRRKLA